MNVIRHNIHTGSMAVYSDAAAAGNDMPVYSTADELGASKVSTGELATFYNRIAPAPVNKFSDRLTAVRRVWAMVQGSLIAPEEVTEEPVVELVDEEVSEGITEPVVEPVVPEEPTEKSSRGRKPGTGEFEGKMVFALTQKNPRRIGTSGFKSFEIIRGKAEGVSYADYVAAGGVSRDLRWDIDRKWAEVK